MSYRVVRLVGGSHLLVRSSSHHFLVSFLLILLVLVLLMMKMGISVMKLTIKDQRVLVVFVLERRFLALIHELLLLLMTEQFLNGFFQLLNLFALFEFSFRTK